MIASPWQKEWNRMQRNEYEFLQNGRLRKESRLNQFLAKKVPEGLQDKLDLAFAKAFELIFEKGTGVIEKTYDKDGIRKQTEVGKFLAERKGDRESLRWFSRRASGAGGKNLLFSGASGIGLGVLGIGLPDIPLFTATMLKGVYETALHFGYEYDEPLEKYFILRIIETALTVGTELDAGNESLNQFIDDPKLPQGYDQSQQIRASSAALSKELLYMKFLQGVPVVGAVGGAYDAIYLNKVLRYAEVKYHRRFLVDHGEFDNGPILA